MKTTTKAVFNRDFEEFNYMVDKAIEDLESYEWEIVDVKFTVPSDGYAALIIAKSVEEYVK